MKNVSAVIVTFNNASSLEACMQAVQEAGVENVIIVDNNSTDKSAALAASFGATLLTNSKNIGFAAAANQGAIRAHAPYIVFLNPDTRLHPAAVSVASKYLEEHPRVAAVGLALTDPATGQIEPDSYGKFPTLWHMFMRKFSKKKALGQDPVFVDWVSGGAFLVRQEIWQQVKGFDENFFLYWEDVDICRRIKNVGQRIAMIPTAICFHERGASLADKRVKAQLYDAGADRYFRKHYPEMIWKIQHYLRVLYRLAQPFSR